MVTGPSSTFQNMPNPCLYTSTSNFESPIFYGTLICKFSTQCSSAVTHNRMSVTPQIHIISLTKTGPTKHCNQTAPYCTGHLTALNFYRRPIHIYLQLWYFHIFSENKPTFIKQAEIWRVFGYDCLIVQSNAVYRWTWQKPLTSLTVWLKSPPTQTTSLTVISL